MAFETTCIKQGMIPHSPYDKLAFSPAGFDLYINGYGKYKTSFKAVSCPSVPGQQGNIQFRFTGSNPWSIKLQARNSK